ncbi:BT_3987 domain-containing protein [Bacteroides sp. 224]|uniref:BT_3987 domain-containing protein n=1 Tax=Bacteroides sp. 224 TaxID=2302936 RepID=UPI0013D4F722|nr:DUF1735 domain-containing protein [Bacteroides sp. 224]NDV63672.1 DUF1735 domain-containing protein [Bacteroides sp. 224]
MKKINYLYIGCLLSVMTLNMACDDALEDELFHKFSYITNNGWQDYKLSVDEDNTAILPIYFGVNGTSNNNQDITLQLEIDPDTLEWYNKDKYKNQTNLYYKELPAGSYTFVEDAYTIPRGELKTVAHIKIDLKKMGSLYNDYVLPLRISSSSGVTMGPNKYTKVLAHIGFKNDFSENYSGKGIVTQIGTSYTTEVTSTELFAINNNTCYFFVGDKTRSNTSDYLNYVAEITKDEHGEVTLNSTVPGLEFKPYSASLERKYTKNYNDQRYYTEITTIKLAYEYIDTTGRESLKMSFDGTFSMARDVLRVEYPNVEVED